MRGQSSPGVRAPLMMGRLRKPKAVWGDQRHHVRVTTQPAALKPHVMERLAFIRLLHQQADEQSRLPGPLSYTCILTYHDATELFLMLAGEQLDVSIPEKGRFVDRYFDSIDKGLNGAQLSGRKGVARLTQFRNNFKHDHAWPGLDGVEHSRADASVFFEENTPKVFGVAFDEIDMADLVVQDSARKLLKDAKAEEASGDRIKAMALLAEAFEGIFDGQYWKPVSERDPGAYRFGKEIHYPMAARDIRAVLEHSRESRKAIHTEDAGELAAQLEAVTSTTHALQTAMRVVALGIEYHRYDKFQKLTPSVEHMRNGDRRIYPHPDYAPTSEDFAYCERFLVTVALRLAEVEAHRVTPPWEQRRQR
ncbi:hypothetical protein ACFQ07_33460 [Actinomadura adrarensis]|uniref:DUF4145 domain-containing protein n=1 Tax=Actinomadura adrarensis TaxID=1819600 RepID=A0ABW3CTC3_9ACTN